MPATNLSDCAAVGPKGAVASVTDLPRQQDRLTLNAHKEAQKAERISGLICALLAGMTTEGTNSPSILPFVHIVC